MFIKKIIYYLSRLTLIDEILGFLYWALTVYGMFLIIDAVDNKVMVTIILIFYILFLSIFYITVVKKIKKFFINKE